jgi:hypothetical protein
MTTLVMDPRETSSQTWWWCRRCHAYVDVKDPGEPYPQCERGHRGVEWREPVPEAPLNVAALRGPKLSPIVFEAKPLLTHKRLPRDQRPSLSEMFAKGYHRCEKCSEVTRLDSQECCVLCGSSQVQFVPAQIQEDAS